MSKENVSVFASPMARLVMLAAKPQSLMRLAGHKFFLGLLTLRGLTAFGLITLGVMVTKVGVARRLIWPLAVRETARSGLRLLPMFLFVAAALGLLVIGQTVSWLSRLGAIEWLGTIMVVAVVRELGPLTAALLVLARVGTAHVIELGTARATGNVEALEAVGVDPVHYLVAPRVVGMTLGVFALTVYMILGAIISGYVWAYIQDVPLRPDAYFRQLAGALRGLDFALLALKAGAFGFIIPLVTSYHGLAQPLRLDDVSRATVRAVAQCVIACVLVDAIFIVVYLTV